MVGRRGVCEVDCFAALAMTAHFSASFTILSLRGAQRRGSPWLGTVVFTGWIALRHVTRGRKDGAGLAVMLNAGQRPAFPLSAAWFRDGLLSAMFSAVAKTAREVVKTQYRLCEVFRPWPFIVNSDAALYSNGVSILITPWLDAFYSVKPDSTFPAQLVSFGTSGHRGSSLTGSFNELHILAIAQAVVDYRQQAGFTGPLFIGLDTHALSRPAWEVALQVLLANQVAVRVAQDEGVTATPLVSR